MIKKTKKTTPLMPNPPPPNNDELKKALIQKALGYTTTETIEEFMFESGETPTLCKRKVTTKQFPPDLDAVQALIELSGTKQYDIASLADFELEQEKEKIIEILRGGNDENNSQHNEE